MPTVLSRKSGGSGGGGAPSGPAGGDLSGTYPNPTINPDVFVVDPVAQLFGAPTTAFEFNTSSLVGLTALSPTPDVENADTTVPGHYYLRDNAATTSCCGRYLASPSMPFTAIAKVVDNIANEGTAEPFAALFVGEAVPGIINGIGHHRSQGSGNTFMSWLRFTNPTTFNTGATMGISQQTSAYWLSIVANSTTDIDLMYSVNGYVWKAVQIAQNPTMTLASVGIMLNAGNVVSAAAFDYLRVWNSALTFPGVVT